MSDHQTVIQAIATLESQRTLLGDLVVDTALWALRQNLASMATPKLAEVDEEHQQLTVLIADLVGYTERSSEMDVEQVRDGLDALWQQLDGVISAWGGKVDQHVGDSVVAHFGLPYPRDDDPERAIQAALEMQLTLAWLNQSNGRFSNNPLFVGNTPLQMRIGIHAGPVLLGRIGGLTPFTAVGDTVTIADYLEQAAPVGNILISETIHRFVYGRFELRPGEVVQIPDTQLQIPTFMVTGSGPRPFMELHATYAPESAPLIGRSAELEQLQMALQLVIDSHVAQFVLITGEDGLGKTRLLAEFERWTSFFGAQVHLVRGHAYAKQPLSPHALLSDIFAGYFDIRVRYNKLVVRERFVERMIDLLIANGVTDNIAKRYTFALGQLLGFDFSAELASIAISPSADWLQAQALAGMLALVTAATATGDILILCLEDIHETSEPMLIMLEALLDAAQDLPLFVVSTAQPQLLAQRPAWTKSFDDPFSPYELLALDVMSSIDGRHLINERLRQLSHIPIRLTDLIISVTGGHPLAIEEMIGFLIDHAVIVRAEYEWRLQMGLLENLHVPSNVHHLLSIRLRQMPQAEQVVLHRAAVLGRLFNDTAVAHLGQVDHHYLTDNELQAALIALEKRGIIYRSPTMSFNNLHDFIFSYEIWRRIAYKEIAPDLQHAYHTQAAYWMIANCTQPQLKAYAQTIADHFNMANDAQQAALWYKRV